MIIQGYLQFWMRYLSEIFWRHSHDISGLFPDHSDFLVCLSVCQLTYFLTEIRLIQGYLQFWMRCLSEIFWKHSQDISGLFPDNSEFFVCLSVCQLAYFLTEIRLIQGYLQFWMIYISEIFLRYSQAISRLCLVVCQLVYFLTEIRLIQGYLQFQMRYLSENFWRHSQANPRLFPNYFEFFVCLSVCYLAYFLTEIWLIQG